MNGNNLFSNRLKIANCFINVELSVSSVKMMCVINITSFQMQVLQEI